MRPSKRTEILAAAARVVERDGVAAVTYDSVAAESGMTKGGLVYHFPSRVDMIAALHEHLAAEWECGIVASVNKPADEASDAERLEGYVRSAALGATRSELLLLLEGSTNPRYAAPWNAVLERWTPAVPQGVSDPITAEQFIARMAADGLWVFESLSSTPLDPDFRRQVADLIADRIPQPPAVD